MWQLALRKRQWPPGAQPERSTPGITAALVGMKSVAHVEHNLAVAKLPPASLEQFGVPMQTPILRFSDSFFQPCFATTSLAKRSIAFVMLRSRNA